MNCSWKTSLDMLFFKDISLLVVGYHGIPIIQPYPTRKKQDWGPGGTSSHILRQRRCCRMLWNWNCLRNWRRYHVFHRRRWGGPAVEILGETQWSDTVREVDLLLVPPPLERLKRPALCFFSCVFQPPMVFQYVSVWF